MATAFDDVNGGNYEGEQPEEEAGIDLRELAAVLQREHDAAEHAWEDNRTAQELAHDYYEGKPFGNEVDGRSQLVLPDVQESVDAMAVDVLRVFVSGDRVVEFEATDEADEDAADEATAAIGYAFMRRQDGYRILHDWVVSGLLERYGVTKTMMVEETRVQRESVTITDPAELDGLPDDVEIEDATQNEDGSYTVDLKRTIREKRSVDVAIPAAEFRFSPHARHEDESDYLAHTPLKTRSDLIDMGFDRDQVDNLPKHSKLPDAREDNGWRNPESTRAMETVLLCEEYARIDLDDDGVAERVKVFRVENDILRWADGTPAIETVDEQPFSVFCPFPRPHRIVGWSLADKIMDVQLARSTIARQLMDGMYNANMPRPIVYEDGSSDNTIDDLLSPIAGSPIRARSRGAIEPYQTSFNVGQSLQVLQWITGERESRAGSVRGGAALDPNALNNLTATEFAGRNEQGQATSEFVARNLAEAFSRLMAKKYRMLRREGQSFRVKVDGQYKEVDPGLWPEDIAVQIRVGLGVGSKDKRIAARMALAPMLAEGFQNGQVEPKHLFNAVDGLVRDLGLGQGDDFWKDPDAVETDENGQPVQKQEQPDPEQLAMQAEQEREQQRMAFEQQKAAAQIDLKREDNMAHIEAMREKHALEMEQKREAAALEAELAQQRAQAEFDLAVLRMRQEAELEMMRLNREAVELRDNRPGGALDA